MKKGYPTSQKHSLLVVLPATGESFPSSDDLQRGDKGTRLRMAAERIRSRVLEAGPLWMRKIAYEDEAIWESEWRE